MLEKFMATSCLLLLLLPPTETSPTFSIAQFRSFLYSCAIFSCKKSKTAPINDHFFPLKISPQFPDGTPLLHFTHVRAEKCPFFLPLAWGATCRVRVGHRRSPGRVQTQTRAVIDLPHSFTILTNTRHVETSTRPT